MSCSCGSADPRSGSDSAQLSWPAVDAIKALEVHSLLILEPCASVASLACFNRQVGILSREVDHPMAGGRKPVKGPTRAVCDKTCFLAMIDAAPLKKTLQLLMSQAWDVLGR